MVAWKNKQYSGCWGYSSYTCERSFTDKTKAIAYAESQLTAFNEYHQKQIDNTRVKFSDLALLK